MVNDEDMKREMPVEDMVAKKVNEKEWVIIPKSYKYDSVLIFLHGEGNFAESCANMFLANDPRTKLNTAVMGNAKVVIPTPKKRFVFK